MPRTVYKKNYEHDDRASGSGGIRKVSFLNGGGRVNKNKRPEPLMSDDGDVVMRLSRQKQWKNKRNGRKSFQRSASPTARHQNPQHQLKLSDWYQVKILYGSKYEKNSLLRLLLKHISPEVFNPISYNLCGSDVVFYIDDFLVAKLLRNANNQILLEDGHLMKIKVRQGVPPSCPINDTVKEKLKFVMAKRYIAATKALDLSKFSSDPEFAEEMYCSLSRPAIMRVIWQIISENISDLVAINLSSNKISHFDNSVSLEVGKLKDLKIVHLEDNNINSLQGLNCFKNSELTELNLKKNPLIKFFRDNTHYVRYESCREAIENCFWLLIILRVDSFAEEMNGFLNSYGLFHSEVRKLLPKLTKLDGMELPPVITFDLKDESKLPTPQPSYMCNPEGRGIVKAFLSQYFAIYDSDNRLDLAQAYHDTSSFSLCAFYPPNQRSNVSKLNAYMQDSRNLFRVTDYPRRKSRLHVGKMNIVKFLCQLPKTHHDLSSFAVDLTLFTPVLINLFVSGVFREPNSTSSERSWPVRHFSRIFLIVPVGQGFCIINDMLLVTNATESEIQNSFRVETQNSTILQSPSGFESGSSSMMKMANAVVPMQSDESVRMQMVQTLATRTGMNLAWSKKCLDETQWDFDRAIWTFTELQSKGTIPPEAFVK